MDINELTIDQNLLERINPVFLESATAAWYNTSRV